MSQPPKQSAVGSWENSSEMLSSWSDFRRLSSWAAAYNSFFCWDRAAFFCQNGRAGTFKFKIEKQKNVDKDVRRGFVFALAYFFFGLLYYRTSCILGKFRFRPPAPIFSLNVGHPTQKGVPTESKVGSAVGKGHAKCTGVRIFSRE